MTGHPYADLADFHFWKRSVTGVERHLFDPVLAPKFRIAPSDRIASAGSCFAQHIARALQALDFDYLTVEAAAGLDAAERLARNYGVYSARFGNLYTPRQLLQLLRRARGQFEPVEPAWRRTDGRFADPFRPAIEPDGFVDEASLDADRKQHLAAVRQMFEQLDVFVFTLGLTEAWRSRIDGAVFPLAPGVVAGIADDASHEFVNFGVAEVESDLSQFVDELRTINPAARILLTVSPVPLVATYEPRHVLVASTYSKAVLRVAADNLARAHVHVDYFPSFEIITGSFNGGVYFAPDHRQVTGSGVAHAMRCFAAHYLEPRGVEREARSTVSPGYAPIEAAGELGMVCEEEAIQRTDGPTVV